MMIEAHSISKSYGSEQVLRDVSFTLTENETLSILGKSGSGKTTLLKIIAGLTQEYTGTIQLNGQAIDNLKPSERGMVYLYQEPLLFPHLTVSENIGFGLKIQGQDETTVRKKTEEMIERLQLKGQDSKYPHQLSGGQKQRVAFGRAFIIHPRVLLLDEPFGSLDSETRRDMQNLFSEISKAEQMTTLFVTHDLKEALITGDRFGMIVNGSLKIFDDREAFIRDSGTGILEELTFWKEFMK